MSSKDVCLPLGFCPECLAKFADESAALHWHKLPNDAQLIEAYCEHRQCGAWMVKRNTRPSYWRMTCPIDVIEWQQMVESYLDTRQTVHDVMNAPRH